VMLMQTNRRPINYQAPAQHWED